MKGKRFLPVAVVVAMVGAALVGLACSHSTGAETRTLVGPDIALGQGTAHTEAVVTSAARLSR